MKPLKVALRLRPFSHCIGNQYMLPGTCYSAKVFPALLQLFSHEKIEPRLIEEIPLSTIGPIKQFTVFQELERGGLTIELDQTRLYLPGDLKLTKKKPPSINGAFERLSLGIHKSQLWEEVRFRKDFREIFPIWLRLGLFLKLPHLNEDRGIFSYFTQIRQLIEKKEKNRVLDLFNDLFLAGFSGVMVPRCFDADFQGISFPNQEIPHLSPLFLLSEGAQAIRSLFLKYEEKILEFLPCLPSVFVSGRMADVPFLGSLSFEWTKRTLRKAFFIPSEGVSLKINFPKTLSTYRLSCLSTKKTYRLNRLHQIDFAAGETYLFDHFES